MVRLVIGEVKTCKWAHSPEPGEVEYAVIGVTLDHDEIPHVEMKSTDLSGMTPMPRANSVGLLDSH